MLRWLWRQIDAQQRSDFVQDLAIALLKQKRSQIVLSRLPEDHPVDSKRALERFELRSVSAQRKSGDMSLDVRSVREWEEPVRDQPAPS